MATPLERYLDLTEKLLAARSKTKTGELPVEEEDDWGDALDDLYRDLSADERVGLDAKIEELIRRYALPQ